MSPTRKQKVWFCLGTLGGAPSLTGVAVWRWALLNSPTLELAILLGLSLVFAAVGLWSLAYWLLAPDSRARPLTQTQRALGLALGCFAASQIATAVWALIFCLVIRVFWG